MSRNDLTLSEKAVAQILEEIATDAASLGSALIDMECAGTELKGSSLTLFRVFADRIGWMAELGAKKIGGSCLVKGGAEDWLLSPVGADAVRKAEAELRTS